jgi:Rhodopirellula transposase DDE domain
MAFAFRAQYSPEVAARVQRFYATLSEKDRRRYAAVEARRLGHGGIEYVAEVLGCSRRTIERGLNELDALPHDPAAGRTRRPGGGRKKKVEAEPQLQQNLNSVLEVRTAGDPDEAEVVWTDLSPRQIADAVTELGTPVSPPVVRAWLEEQGLALHKIAKVLEGGESPNRDAQFQRITELKAEYLDAGNPVFSVDTKAKEHLGQLYRKGRLWTQQAFKAFDHDFPSWATGVVIPHGIYDLARNRGHLNLGLSHNTSAFACDSFRWYWNRIGQRCYPAATSILWLCDCGGSNSATQYLFKQDLQHLVNDLGIEIRVAHYPSYCSKFNPIERRFFPHVGRACQGILFDTLDTVVRLMRKTSTTTGLRATVNVIRRVYETGRKVACNFKETMTILFDDLLPKWNYRAVPQ